MYLARGLQPRLKRALESAPLVILEGARSVGKTYLVDYAVREGWLSDVRSFLNPTDLDAARTAPRDYVFKLPHGTAIDEVQLCEAILLPVKERVERSGPGSLLLTGSTRLRRDQLGGSDPLAGRVGSPLQLGPLTLGERDGQPIQLITQLFESEPTSIQVGEATSRSDLIDLVQQVGMPGMTTTEHTMQDDMAGAYIRQVTSLSNFESLDIRGVNQLARFLAGRTSSLVNVNKFAQEAEFERPTVEKYMARLEEALVIHRLPGWRRSKDKSETARAKIHFFDVGIACAAAKMSPATQTQDLGRLVESLVVTELIRQCHWLQPAPDCFHWRRRQRDEIDLVIENHQGQVVCIEVKTAELVQASDFRAMDEFRHAHPTEFHRGFVFYSGTHVLPFGEDRWAIPFAALRPRIENETGSESLGATVATIRARERDRRHSEKLEATAERDRLNNQHDLAQREAEVQLSELGTSLDGYVAAVEATIEVPLGPPVIDLNVWPREHTRSAGWESVLRITLGEIRIGISVIGQGQASTFEELIEDRPVSEVVSTLLASAAEAIGARIAELDLRFGL